MQAMFHCSNQPLHGKRLAAAQMILQDFIPEPWIRASDSAKASSSRVCEHFEAQGPVWNGQWLC